MAGFDYLLGTQLTECDVDSLSTEHSLLLEFSSAAESLDRTVSDENPTETDSNPAEAFVGAEGNVERHSMCPDVSNERPALQVADNLVVVPDAESPRESSSDSGEWFHCEDGVADDAESNRNTLLFPSDSRSRCRNHDIDSTAGANGPQQAYQGTMVEVKNQSHDINAWVDLCICEHQNGNNAACARVSGCGHQRVDKPVVVDACGFDMNLSKDIHCDLMSDNRIASADQESTAQNSPHVEDQVYLEGRMLAQALRGVHINGSNIELCDVAFQAPPDLHSLPPIIEKGTADISSMSKKQVEAFHHFLTVLGLGLEQSQERAGLEKSDKVSVQKTCYYHHAIHTVVPTHRFVLNKDSLRLTETVLRILKELEEIVESIQDEEQIHSNCKLLFQKYGSHVYVGDIHFGGIYSKGAQYSGVRRNRDAVQEMVDVSLASPANSGVEEVTCFTCASGEQIASSFDNWKSHLEIGCIPVTCIQRGNNAVGIWEILLNQAQEFRDAQAMSQMLHSAWEQIQGPLMADARDGLNIQGGEMSVNEVSSISNGIATKENWDVHAEGTMGDIGSTLHDNEPKKQYDIGDAATASAAKGIEQTSFPPDEIHWLIHHLHLEKFHPEKISMRDVMQVGESVEQRKTEIKDVPWIVLQKVLMLDRKGLTSGIEKCERTDDSDKGEDSSSSGSFGDMSEFQCQDDEINPADIFLATFLCCDLNLRQILVEKMNQCHLGFPLLFPDPCNGSLNLSLWALRNTKLAWRNKSQEVIEASAVSYPLKIVSCLRMGRPEISKSGLINKVIDDEGNMFLNESSFNGNIRRVFADGSVEGSFFLPGGKKTENLEDVTMFLNLRGDGLQHHKQVQILSQLSNVVLVFVDVSDLNREEVRSEMIHMHGQCKEVIIILSSHTKGLSKAKTESILKTFKEMIGKSLTKVLTFSSEGKKNQDKLVKEVRQKVKKVLSRHRGIRLEDHKEMMLEAGVSVDEMNKHCQEGKVFADRVASILKDQGDMPKAKHLPLQGVYWSDLCSLTKHKKRSGQQAGIQKVGEMEMEIKECRKNQDKCCNNLSPLVKAFIEGLEATIDFPSIHFYIQWLKMFFDDFSRSKLNPLLQEYQTRMQTLKKAKDAKGDIEVIQREIGSLEQRIDNATLGLEHLLREIGQIFEAGVETGNKKHSKQFSKLAVLTTKLLLKGHSLEIVDGTASGVPLTWLRAIFSELEKELGDEKLFSLSVLGVQSSGKSTLLNTMFGLQFPVSAGRCTTGVYMQLLKVREDSNLPFKYIAAFDTEGLRAPERMDSNYDHDNELATFVIGLGNLTMMNIKGENITDAKDILQIATHAFLRMKMVNERIQRDRLCVFVHQNVSAFDAKERLQRGSSMFEEALDKMTVEAAVLEIICEIHSFNQVIGFDSQKHIWYFPDLWHGDPPMASVNIGYHEKTLELKTDLLEHQAMKRQYLCNTMEMFDFIADMWNGVQADDFVFGFQNSLVTKSYNHLEEKYSELKWNLETEYREWKDPKQSQVKTCQTHEEVNMLGSQLKTEATALICNKEQTILKDLAMFIDAHGQKEIMYSWKNQKCCALQRSAEILCIQAKKDVDQMLANQEFMILRNNDHDRHKQEIFIRAEQLAERLRNKNIEDYTDLEREFNQMWGEWIHGIADNESTGDISIKETLVQLLYEQYPGHHNDISHELKRNPLSQPSKHDCLEGSISVEDFSRSDLTLPWSKAFWTTVSRSEEQKLKNYTVSVIDDIFRELDCYLKKMSKMSTGFQRHNAKEILRMLDSRLRECNKDPSQPFKMPKNFEVRLAVHLYAHSNKVFADMQDYYNRNYSLTAQLEAYKSTTWKMFLHQVGEKVDMETLAVDMVCVQLETTIKQHIQQSLENAIVKELVPHFYTKKKLIERILVELADHNSFHDYKSYISRPKAYVLEWLVKYTDNHMFSRKEGVCWYGKETRAFLWELISNIQSANQAVKMANLQHTIGDWMASFSQRLCTSKLPILLTNRKISNLSDYELENFDHIQKVFETKLKLVQDNVLKDFENDTSQTVRWLQKTPYEQILDALWGCEAVCPFCKEPCQKSDPGHASPTDCHECVQHRPMGVISGHWLHNSRILVEDCSYSVQSDTEITCTPHFPHKCDRNQISHPLRDYKTYLPEWYIRPSPDMNSSDYWKWFMCKYKAELSRDSGLREPNVPLSWKLITLEKALESVGGCVRTDSGSRNKERLKRFLSLLEH